MKNLINGAINFKKEDFQKHKELYNKLKSSQKPHTLFIGCSDSRIVPDLITSSLPGEIFVIRNIANIIPPANLNDGTYKCTASALEYAVKFIEVENILVCGHSNCGGLKALFYPPEKLNKLPLVKKWLEIVRDLKDLVNENDEAKFWKIEQLNIVRQINNLLSYDFVKERVENKKLNILGWYYVIESGDVYNYNFEKKEFELVN